MPNRRERIATYSENSYTNAIDADDAYRAPVPSDATAYELTGLPVRDGRAHFTWEDVRAFVADAAPIAYEQHPTDGALQKRLFERVRMLYRRDDLMGPLPLGAIESMALPFESYKLAFTPALVAQCLRRIA